MIAHRKLRSIRAASAAALALFVASGCVSPGQRARLVQENEALRQSNQRLERTVVQRDGTIVSLHEQIEHLKGFGPSRPADLFAPVRVEIASLSGGADYDNAPGDDGVTVYLRPRDQDGHVVKVPGKVTVQLLDNADLAKPRVIGVYEFSEPSELRKSWYGTFGTQHYTLKCPFPPSAELPQARRLTVAVEFVDYLTGATLTATREVDISLPSG
jgi:hypothetical protein